MAEALPGQPWRDGEPVFTAPWQARTFAMAVQLNAAGRFAWKDWAARLAANLAAHERHAAIEDSDTYYQIWQETLEQMVGDMTKPGCAE